jgi:hypothetical protein
MCRSPEVTRKPEALWTRRSFRRDVEEGYDPGLGASSISLRSRVRKFYCVPLPSASEPVVARFGDISGGFISLGTCESVLPTQVRKTQRAAAAIRFELVRFEDK